MTVDRSDRTSRSHLASGLVLAVLGGAYLLDDLDVATVRLDVLAPLLLVLAGLALVAGGLRGSRS